MSTATQTSLWLLDTNIISDLMKNPAGRAAQALKALQQKEPNAAIVTSIVAECELAYGLEKNRAVKLKESYARAAKAFDVLPLDTSATQHYAKLRNELERAGTPIGANDMLIAAHALAVDATLVTNNDGEFARIPNLKVANWLRQT
jgi:tRNA(fMet)-specific endonuclease VapC